MEPLRLVVAVHGREVKTALFLALNGIQTLDIVATATSTAELVSYCRAFRPDVAIVESGLPGRPLDETLQQLEESGCVGRVLLIDADTPPDFILDLTDAEVFEDVDHLVAALPHRKRPR